MVAVAFAGRRRSMYRTTKIPNRKRFLSMHVVFYSEKEDLPFAIKRHSKAVKHRT